MIWLLFFFFLTFQPFLGGGEFTNAISGKIRLSKETLVTLDGHWDDCVKMKDKKTGVRTFVMSQCAAVIFNLDLKFQQPNCVFSLL